MILRCSRNIKFNILFAAFVPSEALAKFEAGQIDFWNEAVKRVQQSSYLQIVTDFKLQYIVGRYAGLIFDMRLPKLLAMFLLGFYAYRRGFFQNLPSHQPFIRRVLVYGRSVSPQRFPYLLAE